MNKSRMTFTFRPTPKDPAKEMKPFWEIPKMPYQKERIRSSFRKTSREYVRNYSNKPSLPGRGTWLFPALLAAVTGIVLGLGVLFVFKNGVSANNVDVFETKSHIRSSNILKKNMAQQKSRFDDSGFLSNDSPMAECTPQPDAGQTKALLVGCQTPDQSYFL